VDYISTLKVLNDYEEINGLIVPYESDFSSNYN
ncbi:uncharacterized protein METZ01_LOCUS377620, partial [marine metagenome]